MEEFEEKLEEKVVSSNNYKCPACSGPMTYNPDTMSLKCDFCNTVVPLTAEACDEEFAIEDAEMMDNSWQNETHVIKCENCGSENVVSKKEMSLTCPFCGSTQVVNVDQVAGYKPNRVVPFRIGKEKAVEAYKNYLKGRILAPRKVKMMTIETKVNGTYLPSWTYDADTISGYEGRLGKNYTETVGSGKNRRTVVKTRYFLIRGTIERSFDDIIVNAGKSVSQTEINKILPFNTNDSTQYNESFLAGFSAEHYTKDVKEGLKDAKDAMESSIKSDILSRYDYDVVSYLNVNTHYDNVKYKYVLLPVWIGNFLFNKKPYRFIVNGETSKTTGKYPLSPLRVSILVILIIAAAFCIYYFFFAN